MHSTCNPVSLSHQMQLVRVWQTGIGVSNNIKDLFKCPSKSSEGSRTLKLQQLNGIRPSSMLFSRCDTSKRAITGKSTRRHFSVLIWQRLQWCNKPNPPSATDRLKQIQDILVFERGFSPKTVLARCCGVFIWMHGLLWSWELLGVEMPMGIKLSQYIKWVEVSCFTPSNNRSWII